MGNIKMIHTNPERRRYQRFSAAPDTIVLNSARFGQVINMSLGGLRVKYILRPTEAFPDAFEIAILNKAGNHFVEDLPCRVVSVHDASPFNPRLNLFTRTAGLEFINLTSRQGEQLVSFMAANSRGHA